MYLADPRDCLFRQGKFTRRAQGADEQSDDDGDSDKPALRHRDVFGGIGACGIPAAQAGCYPGE